MTDGALVTGAGKRVGRSLALALGRRGYRVVVHYRKSGQEAAEVIAAIRENGGFAEGVAADLADPQQVEGLIERATRAVGPLTCLINNASTFNRDNARDFTVEGWQLQLGVNLLAPAILARDLAKALPEGRSGRVVNMVDESILVPDPGRFSYAVSKASLTKMTEMLAISLAPAVRVNAIAPGLTLPSGGQTEKEFAAVHDHTLLGRGTSLAAIENALSYLLDAETVTGQTLFVDSGTRLSHR